MVSHPKIETLWTPKGASQRQPQPQPPPHHGEHATTAPSSSTAQNSNRTLPIPRLRNLLSALCFERNDTVGDEVVVESTVPTSTPPTTTTSAPQQQQNNNNNNNNNHHQTTTTRSPPPNETTTHNNRVATGGRSVLSKVWRGSMVPSDSHNGGSSESDIFYDAVQFGNSPHNRDDFLPDTPRESIVLAGVVVTTTSSNIGSPLNQHRKEQPRQPRHPSIETVLHAPPKHDDDPNHPSYHQELHKSVEYTEHDYIRGLSEVPGRDTDHHPSARSPQQSLDAPPAAPPAPDELPLRFLRAGKNDPVEGVRRYQATLQMRREQNIDTILREPSEKFHIIKQYYPHFCHYRGKNNEPCFYEQPPKTNLAELRKNGVTLDKLLRHYTMVTEYQWQFIERDDLARSIYIIDLAGIRMTDFVGEAVDFVKRASAFSAQHYPERAGYVFVINVPGWFKLIWNVVKPIIDEDTLKKIYILRGKDEIRNAMQERIPLEHIPPEYGGTSLPLGQSPQEQTLAEWVQHNNALAAQERSVCHNDDDGRACPFCTWVPARSY